jgi:hypothetical protein
MRIRFNDGSEVVVDRNTMVRCEAIWQMEAQKGNAEPPEPPMPGIRKVPTNEDPLVKEAVTKLVGLWAEANDDMVTWVSDPLEEALRLLDPTALSPSSKERTVG